MSLMEGNVNSQNRHGSSSSSSSSIISTTSSNSHSDTSATCEDLVQSVQQKMNTNTGKH